MSVSRQNLRAMLQYGNTIVVPDAYDCVHPI
jgi:hypothetical protein